jgi:hypothetical protein
MTSERIVRSNGIEIGAPAKSLNNERISVLGKDGKKEDYGPPVMALQKQKKSLMKKVGDAVQVESETGTYLGLANQHVDKDGAKMILAFARQEGVGKPPPHGTRRPRKAWSIRPRSTS